MQRERERDSVRRGWIVKVKKWKGKGTPVGLLLPIIPSLPSPPGSAHKQRSAARKRVSLRNEKCEA